ncbi:replication factor C subunit 5 [Diutina catenulata]
MSLWVDRYRPKQLDHLSYHDHINTNLKALAQSGDFPHLLIYGPPGAGKKTRIYATLNEIFGPGVEKLKIDVKTFVTPSNRKLEFNVLSSPYHLEITPSDMGNNDRVVIQDLLKDVAQTEQVDFSSKKSQASHRFRIVIINEAENLSRDAQAALRRTMEKYSSQIRLIMVSSSISSIISPIRSRTLLVRVAAPEVSEIVDVLSTVATKEQVSFDSDASRQQVLEKIAESSQRNLRRALLCFETVAMHNEVVTPNVQVTTLDWEVILANVAASIRRDQSVAAIGKIRVTFYELLSHCIPARVILKTLVFNLIGAYTAKPQLVQQLMELAAEFDERLSLGQKAIFHLEGFVAKAMVAIQKA